MAPHPFSHESTEEWKRKKFEYSEKRGMLKRKNMAVLNNSRDQKKLMETATSFNKEK